MSKRRRKLRPISSEAETLGRRIRDLRESRRMTQSGLAGATGIAQSELSRMELGRRIPHIPHLAAISRALGTTPDGLLRAARESKVT